jgi:hypothetical protein
MSHFVCAIFHNRARFDLIAPNEKKKPIFLLRSIFEAGNETKGVEIKSFSLSWHDEGIE